MILGIAVRFYIVYTFYLFADDTNLFDSNRDILLLQSTVNDYFSKLAVWFRANWLSLNIHKTNYIMFGYKHLPTDLTIKIDDILVT